MYRACTRSSSFHIFKRFKSSGKNPPPSNKKKTPAHKKPVLTSNKKPVMFVKRIKQNVYNKAAAKTPDTIFQPIEVVPPKKEPDEDDVGEEIAGKLSKDGMIGVLQKFTNNPKIRTLAAQYGLEGDIFNNSIQSFRRFILHAEILPVDIHIIISDTIAGAGHSDDLFPFFLAHSKEVYPHLNCLEDLKNISDISDPANWYQNARQIKRKFIFHAGPTNSGKTYHALKRFMKSKKGIYCGPLRLLAMEVFDKCNEFGTPCDLITGETRKYVNGDEPADHLACTVEMVNTAQQYDVAVIDEIQMIADNQRGWAWTRAVLGVAANEVHVCGERRAVDLIKDLVLDIGDEFELNVYKRLTKLTYLNQPLGGFDNIRPGDCIVCFSKRDIYQVSRKLISLGFNVAIIYGSLPPGSKIMQSQRFNDPNDPCNILVATDAIGMGLNLAIKRIIFYSLLKTTLTDAGNHEVDYLTSPQLKQIGGRAGRYKTQYQDGEVTCMKRSDLKMMHEIIIQNDGLILRAGLNPTAEQIEMFAYHLPGTALSNLVEIFCHVCSLDKNNYFMCHINDLKELADLIEHLPIPIKTKYTFCAAPINLKNSYAKAVFLKMARQFSQGEAITFEWMYQQLGGPHKVPKNVGELEKLEGAFSAIDLYLWLSYRYPDMFYEGDAIRALRIEVDNVIQKYLKNTAFIDKTEKMKHAPKKLSKAAKWQIEKVLGSSSTLSRYDPLPKKYLEEDSDDSTEDSDTDGVTLDDIEPLTYDPDAEGFEATSSGEDTEIDDNVNSENKKKKKKKNKPGSS